MSKLGGPKRSETTQHNGFEERLARDGGWRITQRRTDPSIQQRPHYLAPISKLEEPNLRGTRGPSWSMPGTSSQRVRPRCVVKEQQLPDPTESKNGRVSTPKLRFWRGQILGRFIRISVVSAALIVIPYGLQQRLDGYGPIGMPRERPLQVANDTYESGSPYSQAKSDLAQSFHSESAVRTITRDGRIEAFEETKDRDSAAFPDTTSISTDGANVPFEARRSEQPSKRPTTAVQTTFALAKPGNQFEGTHYVDDDTVVERDTIAGNAGLDQPGLKSIGFDPGATVSFDERAGTTNTSVSAQRAPRPDAATGKQRGAEIGLAMVSAVTALPTTNAPQFRVQIAAMRKEIDAHRMWDRYQTDLGATLTSIEPFFERAETTNGIFYRIQVGPFQTRSEARNFCTLLTERIGSCFVVAR